MASITPNTKPGALQTIPYRYPVPSDTTSIPNFLPPLFDIRFLPPSDRKALAQGPLVHLYVHDVPMRAIPLRLLLAMSSEAQKSYANDPNIGMIRLRCCPPSALQHITSWIHAVLGSDLVMCSSDEYVDVSVLNMMSAGSLEKDLQVFLAAKGLGLEECYTTYLVENYRRLMNYGIPSYEEADLIERYQSRNDMPLWSALVNRLTELRDDRQIKDLLVFERYLLKHPMLQKAIGNQTREMKMQKRNGKKRLSPVEIEDLDGGMSQKKWRTDF